MLTQKRINTPTIVSGNFKSTQGNETDNFGLQFYDKGGNKRMHFPRKSKLIQLIFKLKCLLVLLTISMLFL